MMTLRFATIHDASWITLIRNNEIVGPHYGDRCRRLYPDLTRLCDMEQSAEA